MFLDPSMERLIYATSQPSMKTPWQVLSIKWKRKYEMITTCCDASLWFKVVYRLLVSRNTRLNLL
jgi:hypothetical protein